jgi:hypothetical protein
MRCREHRREPGFRSFVLEPVESHVRAGFEDFGVDRVGEIFDVEDALVVDGHERLSVWQIDEPGDEDAGDLAAYRTAARRFASPRGADRIACAAC